jgi:hypothetical protein
MRQPWHYTRFLDLVDHWQALIAGVLGFAVAKGVQWEVSNPFYSEGPLTTYTGVGEPLE